jgi:hypothetical protein
MKDTLIGVRRVGESQQPSACVGPFALCRPVLHHGCDRLSNHLKINNLNHWHGSCICPADAPRHAKHSEQSMTRKGDLGPSIGFRHAAR